MVSSPQKRAAFQLLVSAAATFPVAAATYYSAYRLRFADELHLDMLEIFLVTLPWLLTVKWLSVVGFRLYKSWTRFVGFHDFIVLGQAVTIATLGLMLVDAMCLTNVIIPRSIVLIDWGATLLIAGALCALPRIVRHGGWNLFAVGDGVPSFIVGANNSGETLLRAMRQNPVLKFRAVGFIDDRPQVQGCRIGGVPVIGTCQQLPQLVKQYAVEEVLITAGELPGKQVRQLMNDATDHGYRIKMLPSYEQLLGGRVAVRPRDVAIEDLLRRDSVELDIEAIRHWLTGRVIMVTGSAGSIGSEICRQLLKLNPEKLVLVDRAETGQFYLERELYRLLEADSVATDDRSGAATHLAEKVARPARTAIDVRLADLTDHNRLAALFDETAPEIVFHAAAYKHVPLMESHCGEAVKNIVLATRNLVDLADEHGVRALVMISTDKAVNPTSVMGSCKRLAEQYVQARSQTSACRLVTVRFGNVLDSAGSVVPIFREQIERGGPVTVTHPDIIRYFMLIPEAAQLVIQAGAMGQGGEIFVLDMGEPVRILDLAHDLIRLSGLQVDEDIDVVFTGLRPGEKLYEELYSTSESHQRTSHSKIMVANSNRRHLLEVIHDIGRLEALVDEPNEAIRAALQQIVPLHVAPAPSRRHALAA